MKNRVLDPNISKISVKNCKKNSQKTSNILVLTFDN